MFKLSEINVRRDKFTLPNGMVVTSFYRPCTPIYLEMSFIAGSRYDPVGKEGLAHFLEHLLVSGTKRFPSKDLLSGFIEDLGGSISARTGIDTISIRLSLGDEDDLRTGIDLLSEILFNSLFDKGTIEIERSVIQRELEMKRSSPGRMLHDINRELVFQGTSISRPILGTTETIKSINKDDISNYFSDSVCGSNGSITVSGGVDAQELEHLLKNKLLLPRGERREIGSNLPISRNRIRDCMYFDNNSLEVMLSFRTVGILHNDAISLSILSGILGGGRSGSLKKKLRYELGIAYSVNVLSFAGVDNGFFSMSCPISKENLQQTLDVICEELKRIIDKGPTDNELRLTKNRIIKSMKIHMQTSQNWVELHDYRDLFCPDLNWTVKTLLEDIEVVTAEEIKKVARRYFATDAWYLAMVGPVTNELTRQVNVNLVNSND